MFRDDALKGLMKAAIILLIGYLALTAFAGFRLGRQIYAAKSNPWVGIGSSVIGRNATESLAIERANVPPWITDSPAFWAALRLSE